MIRYTGKLFALSLCIICLFITLYTSYSILIQSSFLIKSKSIVASIKSMRYEKKHNKRYIVYSFLTPSGDEIITESKVGSARWEKMKGEKYMVIKQSSLYPSKTNYRETWRIVAFIIVYLIFLILSILVAYRCFLVLFNKMNPSELLYSPTGESLE